MSVAALSLPVGVAYADIAGLPPESGIYTAIFSFLCYFLLGSSKELIIGPDSATTTVFASVIISISAGNPALHPQLIVLVTIVTGILLCVAGFLKFGFIANFLSKPILLGYLNGVSVILIISQLGKLTGLKLENSNSVIGIWELINNAGSINIMTFSIGIISLILLKFLKKVHTKIPAQVILIIISIVFVKIFNLQSSGIEFTQEVKDVLPQFIFPDIKILTDHFSEILFASAALLFVSYSGEIPVARSFTKDKYDLNPNKEFFALGFADIVAGLFKGFPVSGADSRTAVNVNVGGKTKMVNIFAAGIMLLVILFLSKQFSSIPIAIFGAIIINAAFGMFKLNELFAIRKFSKKEFRVTIICMAGVLLIGVYQGILIALVMTMIQLIARSSKPLEYELVYEKEEEVPAEINKNNKVLLTNDILIYRFNSALIFFNSNYFRERIFDRAGRKKQLKTIIVDAKPINYIDLTALNILIDVIKEFNDEKINIYFTGADEKLQSILTKELKLNKMNSEIFFPDVRSFFIK